MEHVEAPTLDRSLQKSLVPSPEDRRRIMDFLGTTTNEAGKPAIVVQTLQFEDFPKNNDYTAFSDMPRSVQRSLSRLSLACKMFLSGFYLLDGRTDPERKQWAMQTARTQTPEFKLVYDLFNKLRPVTMMNMLVELETISGASAVLSQEKKTYATDVVSNLYKAIPANLIDPYLIEIKDIEQGAVRFEKATPYKDLPNLDEKLEVVYKMEDIALGFLELVTPEADKPKLTEIRKKTMATRELVTATIS